ncbi:Gfo/Idh/MocA family oxidoreductase [Umezawaea sp. Da 62-37]|uniref:Gfo/Idh/MocA family oxidoreductase n=1 Tax=Umezawaea sp. Da 62-37 TaxID=3075927 RepID=UPI0028F6C706|nr:Gfo/Idh/MocA family oxidoreductase [Umezawaea sp. Da 62-37]WNV82865.1 oxidoreductase [Umezawaea sp. Da 62-37]
MRTLLVGLGRAGAQLHLPVLEGARASAPQLFDDDPVVGCDPCRTPERPGLVVRTSLEAAAAEVDPARTVAHVCTPPGNRSEVISALAGLGFRRMVVEKPLAVDTDDLARVIGLRRRHGLWIAVVEPWLTSSLTARLMALVRGGSLGEPRSITLVQNKPRFRRTLTTTSHRTAFDVELPHGVGLALRLAGNARVTHASGSDLVVGRTRVPRMGGARMGLRHTNGTRTEITSDLTSPARERRVEVRFENGAAIGHYAISADDPYSQLTVTANGQREHEVLRDDSLTEWMIHAYRLFQGGRDQHAKNFSVACDVARLLSVAKNISAEPMIPAAREPVAVRVPGGVRVV